MRGALFCWLVVSAVALRPAQNVYGVRRLLGARKAVAATVSAPSVVRQHEPGGGSSNERHEPAAGASATRTRTASLLNVGAKAAAATLGAAALCAAALLGRGAARAPLGAASGVLSGHHLALVGNVAYAVKLVSFASPNLLVLQSCAFVGHLATIAYNWCRPTPLYIACVWNTLFSAVNLYQVQRLLRKRAPVTFTAQELELFADGHVFDRLAPECFRKLLDSGAEVLDVQPGDELVSRGELPMYFYIVLSTGLLEVLSDDQTRVNLVGRGGTVGETALIRLDSRGVRTPSSVTVRCTQAQTRVVRWALEDMLKFRESNPDAWSMLRLILAETVEEKLQKSTARQAKSSGEGGVDS